MTDWPGQDVESRIEDRELAERRFGPPRANKQSPKAIAARGDAAGDFQRLFQDGLPPQQRRWAIVTICLAIFMTVIDQTIVNVALPTIGADLGVRPSSSVWIVNAYQMAIMLLLLPLASIGDILGYKRVYIAGLGLFGAASLGCALSGSLTVLTVMRVLQGVGASGVMSVNMALVRLIHPMNRLGHGIGINAFTIAVSAAAGPTIAAAILSIAPWQWLFAVNVPVVIAAVAIGISALPESPRASHSFDVSSAVLSGVTFGMLVAFLEGLSEPDGASLRVGEFALMVVAAILLAQRQIRKPSPLLPLDLLRIPMFALSVATSSCSFIAQTLAYIAIPFHLHDIGYSAVEIGLLMTPWPIGTAILAPISGRLADRFPAGLLGLIGLLAFAAGLAAMAALDTTGNIANVVWRMALAGAGFGLFQSPNNRTIQASAPRHRSGGASGTQAMARLLGQTLGAALAALIMARMPAVSAVWFAAGFAVLAACISAVRLTDLP
ncbi:MAG: MFS transporter [Alphaproteobacteria bacterium]|nr:MFS transporter [Alphaproteobacteria bacterium]